MILANFQRFSASSYL